MTRMRVMDRDNLVCPLHESHDIILLFHLTETKKPQELVPIVRYRSWIW